MRASEGTNPCTRPSFATKNVFDVLQDLSESIGGSPGPQLDAADGQPEPIVHDLHQSLVELLERPEILRLHAVRRVGRERQLHLKVRALCGEVEKVFDVLVDTGAQVSLVKAGLLPPECLTHSLGFTRIGEEERRDGEAIALHKTHIWANSLKPVRFLCFLLFWCPLLPFIETGTLKIYTKMILYMKNEIFDLKYPLHGV